MVRVRAVHLGAKSMSYAMNTKAANFCCCDQKQQAEKWQVNRAATFRVPSTEYSRARCSFNVSLAALTLKLSFRLFVFMTTNDILAASAGLAQQTLN